MTQATNFAGVFGTAYEARGEAPGRVNLLGEHTDYNDGLVLPIAIPQSTIVEIARGEHEHVAFSANLNRFEHFGYDGPLSDFARYVGGCLRVLANEGVAIPFLRLWIGSTVPIGAGLASSAALEIAVLRAVDRLLELGIDPVRLAHLAQRAEVEHAGVACGILDQMAASLATPDAMLFLDTQTLERRLVPLPVGTELLVVHSGVPRALAASAYNERRRECAEAAYRLGVASLREVNDLAELERLPEPLRRRARHVWSDNARVLAALVADAEGLGALLNAAHASLRDDFEVSVAAVDDLVADMQAAPGVFGARLTGGGFGGCCVALVKEGEAVELGRRLASAGSGRWVVVPPAGKLAQTK